MNTLGSVPEKSAASDYYSEGIFIVDAADATKCPILWLNAMCKQIIGKHSRHTLGFCSSQAPHSFCETPELANQQIAHLST